MLRVRPGISRQTLAARYPAAQFNSQLGDIITAQVPVSLFDDFELDADILFVEAARQLRRSLDIVKTSHNVAGTFLGIGNATYPDVSTRTGNGVIIGFVDSGIDYTHSDFITAGGESRILFYWDQTNSDGTPPGGNPPCVQFCTGSLWTKTQIDDEIDGSPAGVVTSVDTEGHGTTVSGMAVGNGRGSDGSPPAGTFVGMAPEADIIMVKSSLTNDSVVEAVDWIVQQANSVGKRVVINLSLGGQFGPHDGTSNFESSIGNVAASTPVIVAVGNDHDLDPHVSTTVASSSGAEFTLHRFATATQLEVQFWIPSGDLYSASVTTAVGGTGIVTAPPGTDNTGNKIDNTTINIYNTDAGNPNGDRDILIDFIDATNIAHTTFYISLSRTANGSTGRVDGYNVLPFLSRWTTLVDSSGSVTAPATSNDVIAVGAYCHRDQWLDVTSTPRTDPNCVLGDLTTFSGRGPTRDGRVKPFLSGPGKNNIATLSSQQSPAESSITTAEDSNHRIQSGTSFSAPVVAGAVALDIQVNPTITAAQIRTKLQTQARSDPTVAALGSLPNNAWGHGKLDVLACGDFVSAAPTGVSHFVHGTTSITWSWTDPGILYRDSFNVYHATDPASLVGNTSQTSILHQSLLPNTTYGVTVAGANACGDGASAASASTSTLAGTAPAPTLTPHVSSATLSWTALPAAPRESSSFGYLLQVSTASNFTGQVVSSATPNSQTASLDVSGLTGSTNYNFRFGTLNEFGAVNFTRFGSFTTGTNLFAPGPLPFDNVSTTTIRANWTQNGNPPGVTYEVQASTASNFSGDLTTAQTTELSASVTSLSLNTTYYLQVRAIGGPFQALGSTPTHATAPHINEFLIVFETSVTVLGLSLFNPNSWIKEYEISPTSDFSASVQSSVTASITASFTGLLRNTTYYSRIRAINHAGVPTAYDDTESSSTLTLQPALDPPSFVFVGGSSITARWIAFPETPENLSARGYRLEASTASNFTGDNRAAEIKEIDATQGTVPGLAPETTYYLRLGGVNSNNLAHFIVLGSTLTDTLVLSSQTVSNAGTMELNIIPFGAEVQQARVRVPPSAFPTGTGVSLGAQLSPQPPADQTTQGKLTPFTANGGINITAEGHQPLQPVEIRMTFDPSSIPLGFNARELVIARHDGDTWSILPSVVDTNLNTVTAQTLHFSLFAPFFSTSASVLDAVQIFPIPWMPGSGHILYDAVTLSLTNMPAGARLRIYTILGELIWDREVPNSGILQWDGQNRNGRAVGSGTYLAVVEFGSKRRVGRIILAR